MFLVLCVWSSRGRARPRMRPRSFVFPYLTAFLCCVRIVSMDLVIPSSMVFYTGLVQRLAPKNPDLAQDIVNALNQVDRAGRNRLYRQVIGEIKVVDKCLHQQ